MERARKQRKLVVTFESFCTSAIKSQANLLPIPPASSNVQIVCLPPVVLSTSFSSQSVLNGEPSKPVDQNLINHLCDLPEATAEYILSLREKWLKRLEVCNGILTEQGRHQSFMPGGEEKVIVMLGGVTGVRFACIKKIADDIAAGDLFLAKDILERIEKNWDEKEKAARSKGGVVASASPTPESPTTRCCRSRDSAAILSPTPSRSDTPTPTSTKKGLLKNHRNSFVYGNQSRCISPVIRTPSHFEDDTSSLASEANYQTSPIADVELRGRRRRPVERNISPTSPPVSPPPPQGKLSVPKRESARRPSSLIVLPNASATATPDSPESGPSIHTSPSLTDLRRRSAVQAGISWFEFGEKPSQCNDYGSKDSDLAALIERSLTIKKSAESAYYTCTESGSEKEIRVNTAISVRDNDSDNGERQGRKMSLQNGKGAVVCQDVHNHGLNSPETFAATPKSERLSWLAPPTAGGEMDSAIPATTALERLARRIDEQKPGELFPALRAFLERSLRLEKDWHESVIYLETDTPKMGIDKVIFERLFEGEPVLPTSTLAPHKLPGHHRAPSPAPSRNPSFPNIPVPQRRASWGGGPIDATPTTLVANKRRIKIMRNGNRRKNDMEIQNEARAIIREIFEADRASEDQSVFEVYSGMNSDDEDDEEEDIPCVWRDMFSTKGQWPISRVNLIVALGREGPTDKVKGGSGRVITEAMARRIEGWDLRCRRISLRYLLGVEKLSSALKRYVDSTSYEATSDDKQSHIPAPRQLLAELEFFLSQHEPIDVVLLEFNTNSRVESDAVLELGRILGHRANQESEPDQFNMLKIISVIEGELPKGSDISGIVVGGSRKFTMLDPPPKHKRHVRRRDSQFEEFRFPSSRPGPNQQRKERLKTWKKGLIKTADLVVEDTHNEKDRKQRIPLEIQLEHIYSILDHWNVVARLIPSTPWLPNRFSSSNLSQRPFSPFQCHRSQVSDSKPQVYNYNFVSGSPSNQSRPQTLVKVIVTTHPGGEENDGKSNDKTSTTEFVCPSPASVGTFLEDAGEGSDDDNLDKNINRFQPSMGIVDAHNQEYEDEPEDEDDFGDADDYDTVVAMQYASTQHNKRNSKSFLSKARRRRSQIWFRRKRNDSIAEIPLPAIKRMTVMRVSSSARGKLDRGAGGKGKGGVGLVLVSHKAMKLLGLECTL